MYIYKYKDLLKFAKFASEKKTKVELEQMSYLVFKQSPGDSAGFEWLMKFVSETVMPHSLITAFLLLLLFSACTFLLGFSPFFRPEIPSVCSLTGSNRARQRWRGGTGRDAGASPSGFSVNIQGRALWFGLLVKQRCSVFMSTKHLRQKRTPLNITALETRRSLMDVFAINTNISILLSNASVSVSPWHQSEGAR